MLTQLREITGLTVMTKAGALGAATAAPFLVAGALLSSGTALGLWLMIRQALRLQGLGPICGDHSAGLHCGGCYLAAALIVAGLAVAIRPVLTSAEG